MKRAVLGFLALASAGAAQAAPVRLEPLWTLSGLEDPESVALGPDGATLYVTNVAGEGDTKDRRGFVSRVSLDGKMIQKAWATDLDAPKGAVIAHGKLYVTDITRLVGLDLATGKAVETHELPGAKFLNDAALAPDGALLIADSATARIYAKAGKGDVTIWAEDPQLSAVNGLLPEPDRLVVTTMAGKLLAMDYATKSITVLAEGLGDGDGVARLDDGSYLVSEWPGRLYQVSPDGKAETLIDTRKGPTYINDFIRVGGHLIVPNWKPGSVTAYRIR